MRTGLVALVYADCVVDVSVGAQRTTTWAKGLFHFTGDKKETK